MLRRVAAAAVACALLPAPLAAQNAGSNASARLEQHVVAIYDQDRTLLGAGTSVSSEGLIVTSKHILEDGTVGGSHAPVYRLSVRVAAQDDTALRTADLVAAHPHMDIAVLKLRGGDLILPLPVADPPASEDAAPVVIGHLLGLGADPPRLFRRLPEPRFSSLDRHGHLVLDKPADRGMSGGPVVVADKLVAVMSNTEGAEALALPLRPALDYFRLRGIVVGDGGFITQRDNIGQLTDKIDSYENILGDIQADLAWRCGLAVRRSAQGGGPEAVTFSLAYSKKLRSQPDINARLDMRFALRAVVPGTGAEVVVDAGETEFVTDRGVTAIEVATLAEWLRSDPRLRGAHGFELRSVRAEVLIGSIYGDYIRTPDDHGICCDLQVPPPTADDAGFTTQTEARSCTPASMTARGRSGVGNR